MIEGRAVGCWPPPRRRQQQVETCLAKNDERQQAMENTHAVKVMLSTKFGFSGT